ncbi:MAG TPA: 4Fe-4S ferredoxin, partial [Chloroflexi bacterium]|nr:4Fe-4S ferredoxin [Chloroflexota bacterium]
ARIAALDPLQPDLTGRWFPADDRVFPAQGERRARVALFNGCIQPLAFGATNAATVRVLQANGCEVVVPRGQVCCGALAIHAGERAAGAEQAKRNIEAFERLEVDAIIVNAAGCGVALKEYPELFHDDLAWRPRAGEFSARVQDISEWLVALGPRVPQRPLRLRVTYQDPCHLAHGQRVRSQPRELLRSIPELELVEMRASDRCCGSAGIYNIARHGLSMQVLAEKMSNVAATRPDVIVSANPGCIIQLRFGCQQYSLASEVVHLVDLLDRAYGNA